MIRLGGDIIVSTASFAKRSRTAGMDTMRFTVLFSVATTSAGRPRGPTMPPQATVS